VTQDDLALRIAGLRPGETPFSLTSWHRPRVRYHPRRGPSTSLQPIAPADGLAHHKNSRLFGEPTRPRWRRIQKCCANTTSMIARCAMLPVDRHGPKPVAARFAQLRLRARDCRSRGRNTNRGSINPRPRSCSTSSAQRGSELRQSDWESVRRLVPSA
jgi:hypothetical protein